MILYFHSRAIRRLLLLGSILITVVFLHAEDGLTDEFSSRQAIEKRLAAAIEERPQVSGPRGDALQELESACRTHLATLDLLKAANEELTKAQQALENWKGFLNQPPYPIRFVDSLHENRALAAFGKTACETQIRIINSQLESTRERLSGHQRSERELADQVAASQNPEILTRIQESMQLERIQSRIAAEDIGRLDIRLQAQRAEEKMIQAKTQLAEIQWNAVVGKSSFAQSELDQILLEIAQQRKSATLASAASAATANPLGSWRIEFLDLQKTFWQTRFDALNSADPTLRKKSLTNFKQWSSQVQDWNQIAQLRIAIGEENGAVDLDPSQLNVALQQARSFQRRIDFAIAELGGDDAKIGSKFFDRVTGSMLSIWQAELYLAEETEIIDGKKVTTFRAVTVGKIIRLIAIIAIGCLLLRWLTRRIHPWLSRRSGGRSGVARLVTQVAFWCGIALLIIYGFNTVHIPFTAFAFLGGALAIGVGFGTQTMLKNFISGIILIFERPFKVGDVVVVDGINGRVESIGLRASRINHSDGIDTLVPNSYLLENSLTNWNFTDATLRHSITVSVVYGSNTREVSRILLSVAAEHGLVLKNPEPEVRFVNFGETSLEFSLLFWLDSSTIGRDSLASDLRFMIEKSLFESGIYITSPQRDLRFDPATPLRVEISRTPNRPTP